MSLGNAEKDYVLSVALSKIAETKLAEKLVFKGGTCIKKSYFPKFRFSSDLDFSLVTESEYDQEIKKAFENKVIDGVFFVKVNRLERTTENIALKLQYTSQISEYPQIDSINLEIACKNQVLRPPVSRLVQNPNEYALPKTQLPCMQLEEIFAEKIHAIYNRPKPRDLYDANFLLEQMVVPNKKLIEEKLALIPAELTATSFEKRMAILEPRWKRDLEKVMIELPEFEGIARKVTARLPFNK
ncbi:MAG: nucleotidyl transferase AbiEii/AbiGii toxin family protein [Candidatus Micrarchaeia archaeon]